MLAQRFSAGKSAKKHTKPRRGAAASIEDVAECAFMRLSPPNNRVRDSANSLPLH